VRTRARPIAILSGVTLVLTATLATPARAVSDTTAATIVVNAGSLAITIPASTNIGSASTGTATITNQLGTVTVTDQRGVYLGSWTTTVSAQDFKTGGQTANETIVKGQVSYWSGPTTSTSGIGGSFTPGQATSADKVSLSISRTALSATGRIGNNTAAWNPTNIINIPSTAVVGLYTGTITHSVA
jgi:hypothetical protein